MELIADAKLGPKVVPVATARAPRSPRSKKAPREQKLDCGSLFGWWPDADLDRRVIGGQIIDVLVFEGRRHQGHHVVLRAPLR